ncbi:MAG: hypothetical protein RIB43_01725 [Rhodospirillaceae bacterium]
MSCDILFEDFQVIPRLTELSLPKEVMLEIFEQALGERANVTASDPITTPGTEMWRWTTRFLRDSSELRERGWVACRYSQIDGIRNDELKIKLVVINTDSHTGMPSKMPRNSAQKGPAAEMLVRNNFQRDQGTLFKDESQLNDPVTHYDFWYFCVHTGENYVSAEISRPDLIVARTIRSFTERLILCKPGEMDGFSPRQPVPEDFAEIEQPAITRKH